MQRIFKPSLLLSLAILCLTFVVIFLSGQPQPSPYRFEVDLTSSAGGRARLYFDLGHGFSEALSAEKPVAAGTNLQRCRFQIPVGIYHGLRLEPIDTGAVMMLTDARIITRNNSLIRAFSPADFSPVRGVKLLNSGRNSLRIATAPGSSPPALDLTLPAPLALEPPGPLPGITWKFAVLYSVSLVLLAAFRLAFRSMPGRPASWWSALTDHGRRHPRRALAAMALLAVVINCYPIVFLGRSFVSPNFGTVLLYERSPTLPGYQDTAGEDSHGSDVGATIWQDVPYAAVQHHALFDDHELPLWNRYNSAGVTLLGQGQSMFGDPLHLLVIAANSAAWAWDLKFLICRWLLAFGLGLIVFHGTRHLPSALIAAFSSPFVGFFLYRLNHPDYFGFCYAPWILYCWCRLSTAATWRSGAAWCVGLVAACWTEMNSGTVKEAYMLVLTMNLSGAVVLLFADLAWREKLGKFLLAAWAGVSFVLISAPVWLTFLDALKVAYTSSADPSAYQIHPAVLLGLFDEIFYRPLSDGGGVFNPGANFLVLFGVLYYFATLRRLPAARMSLAVAAAAFFPFALAFGVMPPQWIVRIPFIANLVHVGDVFSPALVIHLIVLAGFGLQAAAARLGTPEGRGDLAIAGLLLLGLIVPYLATVNGVMVSLVHVPVSAFVWSSLVVLPVAMAVLALAARRALIRGKWSAALIILATACTVILLWRQGPQARIGFEPYVFHPAARADFHARSDAVETVLADHTAPFRTTGFEGNLFAGWTAIYGLEGLSGPDAIMNRYYRELLEGCGVDRPWEWRYAVHVATLAALKPVYDFLNIKYYFEINPDNGHISSVLRPVKATDLYVYASDETWPRAFFTDRLAVYATPVELGALVRNGDGRPFAAIQASDRVQAPALPSDLAGRTVVPAVNYHLTANTTSFDVSAPGPGIIVLLETWMKDDFRVEINGHPTSYLRLNHAFKGVAVDAAGTYRVTFSYWPHHFTIALVLGGAGLALIGAIWLMAWRSDRTFAGQAPPPDLQSRPACQT